MEIRQHRTVIDVGGGLTWFACIVISLAIIHFSCGAGTATGYVGDVCSRGLNILDYIGLVFCAPLYLLMVIVFSGGLRIW